jgi:hypothetical protein
MRYLPLSKIGAVLLVNWHADRFTRRARLRNAVKRKTVDVRLKR